MFLDGAFSTVLFFKMLILGLILWGIFDDSFPEICIFLTIRGG